MHNSSKSRKPSWIAISPLWYIDTIVNTALCVLISWIVLFNAQKCHLIPKSNFLVGAGDSSLTLAEAGQRTVVCWYCFSLFGAPYFVSSWLSPGHNLSRWTSALVQVFTKWIASLVGWPKSWRTYYNNFHLSCSTSCAVLTACTWCLFPGFFWHLLFFPLSMFD